MVNNRLTLLIYKEYNERGVLSLTDLEFKILTILQSKSKDEHIYFRGHSELQGIGQEEILSVYEDLTEKGYISLYRTDQMIEVNNSLVNYFYEITELGRNKLCQRAG